jgi:hypothetical protein
MALVLTDIQKVTLSISPKSAAGNPAPVDGVPSWSVSDASVASIVVSENGLSAEVVTTGALGTVQVVVDADADLGEGVETITGVLDIEVKASAAVTLDIGAGVPESK